MKQEANGDCHSESNAQQSYRVQRWRLDEELTDDDVSLEISKTNRPANIVITGKKPEIPPWTSKQIWDPRSPLHPSNQCAFRATQLYQSRMSLSTSYGLVNLIHYNVFFSFLSNKSLLEKTAMRFTPGRSADEPWIPFEGDGYPGRTAIVPVSPSGLPPTLKPTELQMATVHSTWINLVPFPRMRDNLIIWEEIFDHAEFIHDLVGDYIDASFFSRDAQVTGTCQPVVGGSSSGTVNAQNLKRRHGEYHSKNGLILWGEAHDVANWEVTAEFAKRWGWTLKGCEDLIIASNRWRFKRGEAPLPLPLTT